MLNIKLPLSSVQLEIVKSCISRYRLTVLIFLFVTVTSSLCAVIGPLLFSKTITNFQTKPLWASFANLLFFSLTIAAIRGLQDVKIILCNRIEQDIRFTTDKKILNSILNSKPELFITYNSSKISTLLQSLHQSNKIYLQLSLMVFIGGSIDILLSLIMIGKYVDWFISCFVIGYGALVIFLTLQSNNVTSKFHRQAQDKLIDGSNLLGNIISNIISIKVFLGQQWVTDLYATYSESSKLSWIKFYGARMKYGVAQAALLLIQYASIFSILIFTIKSTDITNQLILVSMVLMQLNRPFELIGSSLRDFVIAKGMAEPMQNMLNEYSRGDKCISEIPTIRPSQATRTTIELKNVSYGFSSSQQNDIHNICADFNTGAINFITGPSGVGKTTLMLIMIGLKKDYTGSIKVSGEELKDIDVNSHLSRIGYVPQDAIMMNLSIRDNILIGRSYSDIEIFDILKKVNLYEKTLNLNEGLDYCIGEKGSRLSGGERQRLAIARALLAKPQILLLDEATSALDEATEESVFCSLRKIDTQTLIIAITHRQSVIKDSDLVLELINFLSPLE
jgi:ABC-type multidrug transport system fused ATPase/permease subunit